MAGDAPLTCPGCGRPSRVVQTRYGRRDNCDRCGLHSWDGKPLVSPEVHEARQAFHAAFDPLWQEATDAYSIHEKKGSEGHAKAVKRIRKTARNRAYRWLAAQTGLPEPECRGGVQTDVSKLRQLTEAAQRCQGPVEIRLWAKREKDKAA